MTRRIIAAVIVWGLTVGAGIGWVDTRTKDRFTGAEGRALTERVEKLEKELSR